MQDGAIFKGRALRNVLTGFGTMLWPDHTTYDG